MHGDAWEVKEAFKKIKDGEIVGKWPKIPLTGAHLKFQFRLKVATGDQDPSYVFPVLNGSKICSSIHLLKICHYRQTCHYRLSFEKKNRERSFYDYYSWSRLGHDPDSIHYLNHYNILMYTRSEGLGLQHFLLCLSPIYGHDHAFDPIHCPKNHYILTYSRFESLELQHFLL
jgi:hypothetical protein